MECPVDGKDGSRKVMLVAAKSDLWVREPEVTAFSFSLQSGNAPSKEKQTSP